MISLSFVSAGVMPNCCFVTFAKKGEMIWHSVANGVFNILERVKDFAGRRVKAARQLG